MYIHNSTTHGLRPPNEAFWCIFGPTITTHFGRVSPLSMFSIIQPLFLQTSSKRISNSKRELRIEGAKRIFLVNKIQLITSFWNSHGNSFWNSFGILFGILFDFFLELSWELFLEFFWEFFRISIFVQVGVCGCADVGKEKFDLMTGGGDNSITRSARLSLTRA